LFDIAVTRNQVRGMGGAGIIISDESYAVGVEISENEIVDCSSRLRFAGFTSAKGGLVISNAGECRVRGNRVIRCANGLPIVAYGIVLDTIIGAQIEANQILSNGSQISESTGGMLVRTLADGGSIHDNEFDRNRGIELRLDNRFDIKEIPPELVSLVNFYGHREDSGNLRSSAISIQDNRMHARHRVCEVHSVDELTFAGNQVVMALAIPAFFFNIDTGIVSHNRVNVAAEDTGHSLDLRLTRGSVVGNVTDQPILVRTHSSAKLEHGLNLPQIDHEIV
jgi:hypothetical protein